MDAASGSGTPLRLIMPALFFWALMAGASVSQAAPSDGVKPVFGLVGITIGAPVNLPTCVESQKTDAVSIFPTAHPGSKVDCMFEVREAVAGAYTGVRLSDEAHAASPYLRQDLKLVVENGKVVSIRAMTAGDTGPEQALRALLRLFGPPTAQRAESGAGASFRPATADWTLKDGMVHFSGGAPGYRVGLVEIETLARHQRPMPRPPKGDAPRNIDPDPGLQAAAMMMTSISTDVELSKIRWLLEIDEAALQDIAPESRPLLIETRDGYATLNEGAKLLLELAFRRPK